MRLACASIVVVTIVLLPGCGRNADSQTAEACARVAQEVRGLPDRVKVIDTVETAKGQVEIAYDYVDEDNLTVAGSASCTFAAGGPGSLKLVEAVVDGAPLDAAEVASANRALSKPRP